MISSLSLLLAETRMSDITAEYYVPTQAVDRVNPCWALVPIVLVAAVYAFYNWLSNRPPLGNTPQGMLVELCMAHRIVRSDRKLLERIAIAADIEHPSTLFLSASSFDAAVETAEPSLGLGRSQLKTLMVLRRQLFER